MPRKTTEAKRENATNAGLVSQYRAIGPAAVMAAVLCATRKRIRQAQNAAKPA
ncbi:MAG: transcriptional regulator [Brucellaceae bacterium]|nr:transcriptional regulator [Brucellaceae bacterium]MCO5059240.1 transcriptional regulator [Rhizobiaceae bacterium]